MTPANTESIRALLSEIDWDFRDYVPANDGNTVRGLHWYPAPFPAALARSLIDVLTPEGGHVVDPFCGSGVAPFEAWLAGRTATGGDVNRFAVKLARAKVDLVVGATPELASELIASFLEFSKGGTPREIPLEDVCKEYNIHSEASRWFTPAVLLDIACMKRWISDVVPREWKDVATVLVSSLLHRHLSVVRDYHYTYVVDRSKVPREAHQAVDAPRLLVRALDRAFAAGAAIRDERKAVEGFLERRPHLAHVKAQDLAGVLPSEADLVLTSPPYFGMNDYVRSQYLSWLVFDWPGFESDLENESGSRRRRRSQHAYDQYLADLESAFSAAQQATRPGGYLAVVVGSSSTRVARRNDPLTSLRSLLSRLGLRPLWAVERRVRYRKINNTPYRNEMIWVYQRL